MRILRNVYAIVSEFIILIFAVLWFIQVKDFEPFILIIATIIGLVSGLISKSYIRPKLILHKEKTYWGKSPKGYTSNNPPIIMVGIDRQEMYWELNWNYELEIRNNSSSTAYYVKIEYKNLPPKTYVDGEIGKIEPITPHEKRIFNIRIVQNITGDNIEAGRYLELNADILTKSLSINLKYTDESGTTFKTRYNWIKDENKLILW